MSKRQNPESLPNIRRIDSARTHGYQVHAKRQGKEYTKLFSDNVCGSPEDAKESAILYRDGLLDKLPPSFLELGFQTVARSNTGHVGITHTTQSSGTKKVKELPCFTVSARTASGKVSNTHFYYKQGEYESVLLDAIRWRSQKLKERKKQVLEKKHSD